MTTQFTYINYSRRSRVRSNTLGEQPGYDQLIKTVELELTDELYHGMLAGFAMCLVSDKMRIVTEAGEVNYELELNSRHLLKVQGDEPFPKQMTREDAIRLCGRKVSYKYTAVLLDPDDKERAFLVQFDTTDFIRGYKTVNLWLPSYSDGPIHRDLTDGVAFYTPT